MATDSDNVSVLAKEIHLALVPSVVECDKLIHGVIISQRCLNAQLDKLQQELEKFNKEFSIPSLTPYVHSLYATRSKIEDTNRILVGIHKRLEKIRDLVQKNSQTSDAVGKNYLIDWE